MFSTFFFYVLSSMIILLFGLLFLSLEGLLEFLLFKVLMISSLLI